MPPPETLHVDPEALRGYGNELVAATADIPEPPEAFTVAGADAISAKIASLLPTIEGPILTGLPEVKKAAGVTANGIVDSADTYLKTDEELTAMILGAELGGPESSGRSPEGSVGTGGSMDTGAPSGSGVMAASNSTAGSAGSSGSQGAAGSGGSDPMGMPMQMAGMAAQIPGQVMGAAASVPQSIAQGAQQVAQLAGGSGDDYAATERGADGDREDGAAAEQARGERAPAASPDLEGAGGPADTPTVTQL